MKSISLFLSFESARSQVCGTLSFWSEMWKLLADLLPGQLKLECKRASISPSEEASHNLVRISKYIMANGYDPETFYFNTLYESDSANNLMGMIPTEGKLGAGQAQLSSAAPFRMSAGVAATSPLQSKREDEQYILSQIKKMSSDIDSLKLQMDEQRRPAQKKHFMGSGLERDRQDELSSLSGLSSRDSFGSSSSESSVGSSFFSEKHRARLESRLVSRRKYNKDLLIENNICLAFQHGTCSYEDDYVGYHPDGYGHQVLHFCGLCETDSPDNQCYYPANKCPGPSQSL